SDEENAAEDADDDPAQPRFIAHVPVPTQKQVEEALVMRKKAELLQQYASLELLKEVEETKSLIGK
ncbi:hypothetical protein AVEN_207734-1, partial [Araneus ventricosus]